MYMDTFPCNDFQKQNLLKSSMTNQGCYLDECQWFALAQVDSGTYTGDSESLE